MVHLYHLLKKHLKQLALLAILVWGFFVINFNVSGQACSATWTLTSSTTPAMAGAVTSPAASFGSGVTSQYTNDPTWGMGGQNWSGSSTAPGATSTVFLQFSISPTGGSSLNITNLTLVNYNDEPAPNDYMVIYRSTDATFGTGVTTVVTGWSLPTAESTYSNAAVGASCTTGQTIYFRVIYYYVTGSAYFGAKSLVLTGTTTPPACTAPTTQATGPITFNSINGTSMNIAFTRGNGTGGVMVIAKAGSAPSDPTSGTSYAVGAAVGGGTCVYNGTAAGASVATGNLNITGLTCLTTYYYAVYEYNTSGTCYHLTELTGNAATTCTTAPAAATTPSPTNGATGVATGTTLSWAAVSCAASYDVYFGTSSPGAFIGNQAGLTYSPAMSASTLYYWRIDAKNTCGTTTGNVWSFTTTAPSYCGAGGNMSYVTGLTNVTFNGINNTTAKPAAYTYYTSPTTTVTIGTAYNLSTKVNTAGNYTVKVKAWIDWNQNGTFDVATEEYDMGTAVNVASGLTTLSPKSITIPGAAAVGKTRMRVAARYNVYATSCLSPYDGEVEDYDVTIVPACTAPTSTYTVTGGGTDCSTGPGVAVGLNNSQSGVTYQLYNGASPVGGTVAGTGAALSFGNQTTAGTYTVQTTSAGGYCVATMTGSVAVTINTTPSIGSQSTGAQNKCQNAAGTAMTVTASGTSLSYLWYSNTVASNSGGTLISGATSSSYTPPTTTAGTLYYYCIISGAAPCASVTSAVSGAVVINALPAAVTVSTAGTYCTNTSLSATGGAPGTIYWQNTTPTGTSTVLGGTPQTVSATGTYYYGSVSAGCWTYGSAAVTINTAPSIGSQSTGAQNKCQNAAGTAMTVTASGTSLSYQWYSNTVASNSGGSPVPGATSSSFTPPTTTAGTLYYYCVVSGAAPCSAVTSAVSGAVVINSLPSAVTVSTAGTYCNSTSLSASGGAPGTIYWQNTTPTGTSTVLGGTPQSVSATGTYYYGSNNAGCWTYGNAAVTIITIPAQPGPITGSTAPLVGSSQNYSVTNVGGVTYTWAFPSGWSQTGGGTTNSVTVTVGATSGSVQVTPSNACGSGTPQTLTANVTTCIPVTVTATATANNIVGYAGYNNDIVYLNANPSQATLVSEGFNSGFGFWTTSTSGTNALDCDGDFFNEMNTPPALAVVPSDNNYFWASPILPLEGSNFVKFNSYYTPANNIGYLISPVFSTVGYTGVSVNFYWMMFINSSCGSSEYVQVGYSINGGSTWTDLATQYIRDGGGAGTQCPSWANFSSDLSAAAGQANVKIRFTFHSGTGCFCGLDMLLDMVTVTGTTAPGGYGYYTYSWASSGSSPLTISNSSLQSPTTNDIDGTPSGYSNFTVTVTDGNGCTSTASTSTVNVNPNQNGSAGSNSSSPTTVCPGGSSTITFSGSNPGTIQWQQSTNGGGSWTNVGTNSTTYNPTNITQTTWYRVKLSDPSYVNGSCLTAIYSAIAVVTVPASGTISANTQVCSGYPVTISISGGTGGTYQWQQSPDNATWSNVTGGSGATTANYTTSNITSNTYYQVITTTSSPVCGLTSSSMLVSIKSPIPVGTTNNWNGSVNTDWADLGNWDCVVPVCGQNVIIPSGKPNYPVISTGGACQSITINAGASLTTTGTANLDVCGDWNLSGSFIPNNGSITFRGGSAQNINSASTFYSLGINKTGNNVTLIQPVTVTGSLILTAGNFITGATTILTLGSAATTTLGSSSSFVNGPMINSVATAIANTIRNFPIGKGTAYRPFVLTVSHTNASSVTYTGELINSSAAALGYSFPGTLSSVSNIRYWQVDRQSVSNLTSAAIQLFYSADDDVTDYTNLSVAKTTGGAGPWIDVGGTATANTTGNVTSGSFSSFSRFTLGNKTGGGNQLPIELVYFSSVCKNDISYVNWSTASETNNDFFTLERSLNGLNFSVISTIRGAGTSTSMSNYEYIDLLDVSSKESVVYYRLKQTDFDGKYEYSDVIATRCLGPQFELIAIMPNPTHSNFTVFYNSPDNRESVLVEVRDMLGRIIQSAEGLTKIGGNTMSIDISDAGSGVYFVIIISNNTSFIEKIIKH